MRSLIRRLSYVLNRRRDEEELAEELEFHRAERQAALERDGMRPEEAAAASRRAMGNVTLAREEARDVWIARWVQSVSQDARYALRTLRGQPGFAVVVLATLGAAIGLNASVFTVFSAYAYRPWPVPDPEAVVRVHNRSGAGNFSNAAFRYMSANAKTMDGMFAARTAGNNVLGEDRTRVLWVTGGYFRVLGVQMALGRGFADSDDRRDADGIAAVLSHAWWQRAFGGDRDVVGRVIRIEDVPVTVVGVASRDFTGTTPGQIDVWLPMSAALTFRPNDAWVREELAGGERAGRARVPGLLAIAGRLARGVTREQAQAELEVLAARVQTPQTAEGHGVRLSDTTVLGGVKGGPGGMPFKHLFGGMALVMLLACANVGNLLLARAAARQREIAVRLALGASRRRVVRQLLTESLVLACGAGVLGVVVAWYLPPVVMAAIVPQPIALRLAPDEPVLAFALALSAIACGVFGLAPALLATRSNVGGALKNETPFGMSRVTLRGVLLTIQVAASVVLLASAALLLRGAYRASTIDHGFTPDGVSVVSFEVPGSAYDAARTRAFAQQLTESLAPLAASGPIALTQAVPFGSGNIKGSFRLPGGTDDEFNTVYEVSPRYFEVLRIPVLAGRMFGPAETGRNTIVVNESLARMLGGAEAAVGKTLFAGESAGWNLRGDLEIVGVVGDSHTTDLQRASPTIYQPVTGRALPIAMARMQSAGEVERIAAVARRLEPRVRVRVAPLTDFLDQRLRGTRVIATIATVVGVLALALASVGMFGVFAFWVQQRTREIGVRMALGARSTQVIRTVLASSARAIAIGLVMGVGGAVAGSRLLERALFGLSPLDPIAYLGVGVLLVAAAVAATLVPARRALRVDPAAALRCDG